MCKQEKWISWSWLIILLVFMFPVGVLYLYVKNSKRNAMLIAEAIKNQNARI